MRLFNHLNGCIWRPTGGENVQPRFFGMRVRKRMGDRRRLQPYVAGLEVLEDRFVLSGFKVTNLLDGGAGSLRQAILDANTTPGADEITFASDVRGTITLSSGQL